MAVPKNLISIIVPCYNQAPFLDECLQSVLNQTHSEWECLIINDGSTDHTEQIALQWTQKDNRFRYIYKENGGLSSARNAGIAKAVGNFIQFLDSDDFLDAQKLRKSIDLIETPNSMVVSHFMMYDSRNKTMQPPYCQLSLDKISFEAVALQWDLSFSIPIHCGLFPTDLLKKHPFTETLKAKEDWIMWLQILKTKPTVFFIDEPLAFYRLHPTSMTQSRKFMNQNLTKALPIVISLLPDDLKVPFYDLRFPDILDKLSSYINKNERLQQSKTYQVGHWILAPFKRLKKTYHYLKTL